MAHAQTELTIQTNGRGLYEFTVPVLDFCRGHGIATGLLTIFCRHTSASLTVQENADPDVIADLNDFFGRLVSDDPRNYRHTAEGVDDMPAHVRSALTDVSLTIPVGGGKPLLGTWQGIYLFEHRLRPHRRTVVLHLQGDMNIGGDFD